MRTVSFLVPRSALFVFCMLLLAAAAPAAELTGTVKDYATGQPLSGAAVLLRDLKLKTATDYQGGFRLTDVPAGIHVIVISLDGYQSYTFEQHVAAAAGSYRARVELKPSAGKVTAESMAEQPRYILSDVTVLTTRAAAEYPVTFSNVPRADIAATHYGQDTPQLLADLPNVSVYSEGGGGFGYSYLRMRGFGQDRIAVQINGIPLNDAETHEVFWVDLPDFAEDLADLQVQRGVGSSLYGPAAFGGTVNLVTQTPGLGDRPLIRAEGMYGTWNTRRAMVQIQSGKVADRYGVTGRITRMESDGYRFGSWAKLWSYYLAGARFTDAHTTRLLFYGGPEQVHLAYEGVSQDFLDGRITGNKENDRRFNEFQYSGEIDNFFQPHYELHDEWRLAHNLSLDNSLYLFKGDGYYDQWRAGQDPNDYFFSGVDPNITELDLLRRRNISETDWGWIPRLNIEHRYGETTVGGESRIHDARHAGIVLWSDHIPFGYGPDYRYYDYELDKRSVSGYVHNLLPVTARLKAMLDVQAVSHTLTMRQDKLWNVTYEKTYRSVTPRAGLNYTLTEADSRRNRPAGSVYTSLSFARREPRPRDIYDPQDFWALPLHAFNAPRFQPRADGFTYVGPSLAPEKLLNIELGTHWQWPRARVGLNVYHMALTDAIVPYGELDHLGVPKSINAEKTVHDGIELVAAAAPLPALTLSGNLALTQHRFVRHAEYDWSLERMVKRDGNRIGFDPQYTANLRADFSHRGFRTALAVRGVGKQYIDNTQTDATAVPASTLLSLELGYRLERVPAIRALELHVRVNNLLDTEYETFGYNYTEPRYFVGAPRAIYVTTAVEL